MAKGVNTALHPARQVGRERGDDGGAVQPSPNPWWLNTGPSPNSDPHQAVMTGALPTGVAAPADTQGYHPVGFLHAILGDYRPKGGSDG